MIRTLLAFYIIFLSFGATAATKWMSPSGAGARTGADPANAWSQSDAESGIASGDTVIALDGDYLTSISFNAHFWTLQASNKWGAIVYGSPSEHSIYALDGYHTNTVDGMRIANSYISGIKMNGHGWTIKNCWIEGAGRADAAWVTNTSGAYTGQGIESHGYSGTTIENCYIKNNGARLNLDHGMYVSGTNITIRNNISESNVCWGIQLYDGSGDVKNCSVYNNLVLWNGGLPGSPGGGIVCYANAGSTNNFYNNTIISPTYGSIINGGRACFTNNIIQAGSGYEIVADLIGTNVHMGYNLRTSSLGVGLGTGDVVTNDFKFDSSSSHRYWLASDSPARGAALSTKYPPVDFWGSVQTSVKDVGAFQFEDRLWIDDSRNYVDVARDPWTREPVAFTIVPSVTSHELRWIPRNNQAASYTIARKDSVNNTYATIYEAGKNDNFYADPTSAMTNGVTYTYTISPTTSLGNGGGIHTPYLAVICDKTSAIHPARLLAWGTNITGLPNGTIPTYTFWSDITTNIPGTNLLAVGDGITDNVVALETAWKLCPSNYYIYLPAGDYLVNSNVNFAAQSLTLNNKKALIGAGTNLTFITPSATFLSATNRSVINFGVFNEQGTERIIGGSLAKGATTLSLPGGLGTIPIQAGSMLKIWENPSSGVYGASQEGNADPVYNSNDGSTFIKALAPLVRDTVLVTSVSSGTNVTFWPPLINSYSAAATVQYQYLYMCNDSGLEGFTIDNTLGEVARMISWEGTARCWLKDIRTIKAKSAHVRQQFNTLWHMEGCYMHDAIAFGPNEGIGLQLSRDVDSGVCRNNVFSKNFPAVEFQKACDGNLFFGNLYLDPQNGIAPIDNHGGHNSFNCFEQETGYGVVLDGYFNTAAQWTFNRCFFHGDQSTFGARKVLNFSRFSRNISVLNSVLGFPGTNWVTEIVTNGWNDAWAAIGRYGYPSMGNDNFSGTNQSYQITNIAYIDIGVKSNLYYHANYSFATNGIGYNSSVTNRTYPTSLFNEWNTVATPAWYANAIWPAIGNDSATMSTNYTPVKNYYYGLTYGVTTPNTNAVRAAWRMLFGN